MPEMPTEPGRILLFVRRVMPNATEEELIAASERVREYVRFVLRVQDRIERDRQAAIRANETDSVDSEVSL
jgi:hypothetical protein